MGILSAFFVIVLSLSGLTLHHVALFGLDSNFIGSSALLGWYDIEVPDITISYSADDNQLALIGEAIYFNEERVAGDFPDLRGFVDADFGYLGATSNQLLLLNADGQTIEILGGVHGVPAGITSLAISSEGEILVQQRANIFLADLESLSWELMSISASQIDWSVASDPRPELSAVIASSYGDSLLSWERLILDIHSGRVFGGFGAVLVDLMALLFVFMAATGVWIWSRKRS